MKNIIVREYLESLTESTELDYIFPILLEVMDFQIVSKPSETKGLAQYGKDVIAIGTDLDGVRKRFYFEIKGGADRHITDYTYTKGDGIRESIIEAKDKSYNDHSIAGFNQLPVKIIVVHNGTLHPSVKETFDGFIEREFPTPKVKTTVIIPGLWKIKSNRAAAFEFERWDLSKLTELFTQHLFNEYLLTDEEAINNFKKVLVLINTPRNNNADFFHLINSVFQKAGGLTALPERKRFLFFETLRLVSFIVYHYSMDAQNLTAAKQCIPYSILKHWHSILEAGMETDKKVMVHFKKHFEVFQQTLHLFFEKTLPVTEKRHGLFSPHGGRYEQVGYPVRAMDYLSWLVFYSSLYSDATGERTEKLLRVLQNNDGTARPLFDNHSIPVIRTIRYLIDNGRPDEAKAYLDKVIGSILIGYSTHGRIPDGRSRMESLIQYSVRHTKSVFYEDSTSHLVGMLLELTAVLDMEMNYLALQKLCAEAKLYAATYIPYDDVQLMSSRSVANKASHELHLFLHELYDEGFQEEVNVHIGFAEFKDGLSKQTVADYHYRTVGAGMGHLLDLAHIYFKTPYFPSYWRTISN